jgi:exopolysaccharide biosynthesis protein
MKLLFINSTRADAELISFLAQQSGLEVVLLNSSQLDSIRNSRTPEAKLQAFKSILAVKPLAGSKMDDANWSQINNLSHNKEIDASHRVAGDANWTAINNLDHNKEIDAGL